MARASFLLLIVWWAWVYTTWMANWFDPGSPRVRLVLAGVMLASLVMAAALPEAFGDHGLLFACGYVTLQLGRNIAAALLLPNNRALRAVFERLVAWSAASGVLWLTGATLDGDQRLVLSIPALALEFAGPAVGYWLPTRGRAAEGTAIRHTATLRDTDSLAHLDDPAELLPEDPAHLPSARLPYGLASAGEKPRPADHRTRRAGRARLSRGVSMQSEPPLRECSRQALPQGAEGASTLRGVLGSRGDRNRGLTVGADRHRSVSDRGANLLRVLTQRCDGAQDEVGQAGAVLRRQRSGPQ